MTETKLSGATYEVWDLASRNIIGEFTAEQEALAFVCTLVEDQGPNGFALVREDEHGDSVTIAMGADLVALARHRQQHCSAPGTS